MFRIRMIYAMACFGILITTGGCAESATAPEAASLEASDNRSKQTPDDSSATLPETGEDSYTVSSGFITGGGRAEP